MHTATRHILVGALCALFTSIIPFGITHALARTKAAPTADAPAPVVCPPPGDDGAPSVGCLHEGKATWYADVFEGKKTSSGEPYDPDRLTAAHRSLPLGSKARIVNARTRKSVVVTINDRGPYDPRWVIDLSLRAAREVGVLNSPAADVKVEPIRSAELGGADLAGLKSRASQAEADLAAKRKAKADKAARAKHVKADSKAKHAAKPAKTKRLSAL